MNRIKLCGLLLTFSTAFCSTPALAYYKTGEELYTHLKEFENQAPDTSTALRAAGASGFVLGVAAAFAGNIDTVTRLRFCFNDGVTTYAEILDVTLNYLKSNPNIRSGRAQTVVVQALSNKYPCK